MNRKIPSHEFAFFYPDLSTYSHTKEYVVTLTDAALVHRIVTVLRMHAGDTCVLFNSQYHGTLILTAVSKKEISGILHVLTENRQTITEIVYCVPLLKRDSLDTAIYSLTELAITVQAIMGISGVANADLDHKIDAGSRPALATGDLEREIAKPEYVMPGTRSAAGLPARCISEAFVGKRIRAAASADGFGDCGAFSMLEAAYI